MVKLVLLLTPAVALAYEFGPYPRYTAAPGDDPVACASAGCHTGSPNGGPINAGGGGVTATFSSGSSYTPGGPAITITVSVSDPVNTGYGFQMTARLESDLAKAQAGDFTPGANQLVVCDDGSPKVSGKTCPAASPVEFIEHFYQAGTAVKSTSPYIFTWTPPATNVGPVHFYVAGNAVTGKLPLTASGADHVYTASYVLTPVLCPPGTPIVANVISAGAYGAYNDFAPGSWLEVYGSNFASNQQQWQSTDFTNGNAPTLLAGISVSINGKPGYVSYVSSGQINVQAPADTFTGVASVIVKTCSGSGPPFSIQELTLSPGLLAPQSFLINGTQYLVAFHQDGSYVGNGNLISGLTFSPAKPGETLTIYGVGFGGVKKNSDGSSIPPGVVVADLNTLASPLTFAFGSTPATLQYQGLAPNFVGLYQFNVVVPSVANGDVPINVTLNGTALSQKLVLTVHN